VKTPNEAHRLAVSLAIKARELLNEMRDRVDRDPDIADYTAAFEKIIVEYET